MAKAPINTEIEKLRAGIVDLENSASYHIKWNAKWGEVLDCLLSRGSDPVENIRHLTSVCGRIVNADFVRYGRHTDSQWRPVSTWNLLGEADPCPEFVSEIYSDSLPDPHKGLLVVRNLPLASEDGSSHSESSLDRATCCIVAVGFGENSVGSLEVYYKTAYDPREEEKKLIEAVAVAIGQEERQRESDDDSRRERRMLMDILWASPLGISYVEEGKLKWTNPAMARMFGSDFDESDLGKNLRDFYCSDEEYRKVQHEFYRFLSDGKPAEVEARLRRKDGSTFHGQLKISAVDPSHPKKGTITTISDISVRKGAEEALRESEERYRLLAESSLTGIYIHQDGRFVYVNDRLATMLGYRVDEVIGTDFWDYVHPDDREVVKERGMARSMGIEISPHYEFRVVSKNHDTKTFEVMATTIMYKGRTANMGNVADITKRKKVQEELRRSEENLKSMYEKARKAEDLYRSLLESSPAAIVIYDLDGRAQFVNDSFVRIFGWNREELIGKRIPFVPESELEISMSHIRRLIEDGISVGGLETRRFTKDGALVDVSVSASRYHDHEDNPAGLLVILADISERKRAEDLLLQAERLKALGEMATGVAHNFNNLLQIVTSSAQMALSHISSRNLEDAENKLRQILESSEFGSETVKRLQDFSRIRTTRKHDRGMVFDLADTAKKAIEMSQLWLKTKPEKEGYEIVLHTDLATRSPVLGHESEIFEVLVNLIKNAAEALPTGGAIRIACAVDADNVILTVQDDGIGISEKNLERVFDPFWTSKKFHAEGMGLASCLGIVRQHRGEITVHSREGHGSTFALRLPCAEDSVKRKESQSRRNTCRNLHLLLIDDVEPILTMLGDGLKEMGQTVYSAVSGKEGIEIFSRTPIDLVICDLGMPEMNGWQVGETIKRMCRRKGVPKTPFILLTGWGEQLDDARKIQDSGVNRIMGKPVAFSELFQAIQDLSPSPDGS
jgi:PAS domain S-box-containing protein